MSNSEINDPFYCINRFTINNKGCILLPQYQIHRLLQNRPIFVHKQKSRRSLYVIEIHCENQKDKSNLPVFEANDVLVLSEDQLNKINNYESLELFTHKNKRVLVKKS